MKKATIRFILSIPILLLCTNSWYMVIGYWATPISFAMGVLSIGLFLEFDQIGTDYKYYLIDQKWNEAVSNNMPPEDHEFANAFIEYIKMNEFNSIFNSQRDDINPVIWGSPEDNKRDHLTFINMKLTEKECEDQREVLKRLFKGEDVADYARMSAAI